MLQPTYIPVALHLCLWVSDTTWALLGAGVFSSPFFSQYQSTGKGSSFGPVALKKVLSGV